MAIFSMMPIESLLQVREVVEPLLNLTVVKIEGVDGGRNSRLYKLTSKTGECFAAKFCADSERIVREFGALKFLIENGFRNIPRPIIRNTEGECAIYEFIEGTRIGAMDVLPEDIDSAADFLARLQKLTVDPESFMLSNASEACFSIGDIISNLQDRVNRLQRVEDDGPEYNIFRVFLTDSFEPAIDKLCDWVQSRATERHIGLQDTLSLDRRTLSPSDFGFHNVLRRQDGVLVFLDFEHFGWDDPAKMVADFLLHPHEAMAISESLKRRFFQRVLASFPHHEDLKFRIELVYPMFGLKWCTILLNEFVLKDLERRLFANDWMEDRASILQRQMIKAEHMLNSVLTAYQYFPYQD